MRIGGLQKLSLIDFPGLVSAVVFVQGCNFRCVYCHNRELVYPHLFREPIPDDVILSFLDSRKEVLDGVVVTGGEPLLQPDIESFLREVRRMGYRIKLDTNGSRPERLEALIGSGLVDYVAMDYKAPLRRYPDVTAAATDAAPVAVSAQMIADSGIHYEMRTTVFSGLKEIDLLETAAELVSVGVESYYLQVFRPFSGCGVDLTPEYPAVEALHEYLLSSGCFRQACGIRNSAPGTATRGSVAVTGSKTNRGG